ncbi:MAG TPA: hypothetical protein VHC43_16435 [Mycobacteriales bacterium]|nr:hypothetical protein [Mycobacteriales bacterium]
MRRTGRSALAQGAAAVAVMAAGVVVVATNDSTPVSSAATVLGAVRNARIVSASGATRVATAGMHLLDGDVVSTGSGGSAELNTRGRTTLLGAFGALAVVNGSRQQLRTGTAVVDALHGPSLDIDLSGDTVSIPRGSATEAARGPSTRVGALSGPAAITSTGGRRLVLTALSQAVLSGDALPAGTTPLHLTDSAHESTVVPALVRDDEALQGLARGIDTTGRSTAHVVEASWTGTTPPVPNHVNRSERVLPVLIADSTHGGTAQQRYDDSVAWRAEGGSWGVVLHLLSGRASAVEATLAALQRSGQSPGRVGTVTPTGVSAAGNPPTVRATRPVTRPSRTGSDDTKPPASPGPGGVVAPSPPPDNLLGGLVVTVQNVIDGVLGILPHDKNIEEPVYRPKPKPKKAVTSATQAVTSATTKRTATTTKKSTAKASTDAATPAATATPSNGLLSNLLGGLLHPQG